MRFPALAALLFCGACGPDPLSALQPLEGELFICPAHAHKLESSDTHCRCDCGFLRGNDGGCEPQAVDAGCK
jgi:hypothetical protein